MKSLKYIVLALVFISCTVEDDYVSLEIEEVVKDEVGTELTLDIIYVVPSNTNNEDIYNVDEDRYIYYLNSLYFHRNDIGFVLGDVRTLVNDELYDLTDNQNQETKTFLNETESDYNKERLSIYIIKRENTIGIAGLGYDQRLLITDEFLFESTSPHEIGHSLGLGHTQEEGNIMSQINPHLREKFSKHQINILKVMIGRIKNES